MTSSRVENSSSRAARKVKLALMGPAFVAAIGYIDPGNFATNIQAGASFGYQLLWVVVWANLMAMLIQVLSAKLGIATGKNLAEQIRDHYPRPVVWFYWVATFLILMLQRRGQKPLEKVIGGLLLFVAVAYVVELIFSQPALAPLTKGLVIPTLPNGEAVFLAAGVLGATIMPHVIYLHSSLTQHLHGGTRKERYNATRWDVAIAMTIAGFVNLAMMATAAAAFHFNGHTGVADLDQAYMTLEPLLSHAAATIFGLSLIAAGLSSTVVGTLAGQVVMQGFIRFHIPLWFRRAITMLPSFVVILLGLDPTRILVMSQVLLSFGIALALVPLLIFTSNAKLMGDLVNTRWVRGIGWAIVAIVVSLNGWLIVGSLLGVD